MKVVLAAGLLALGIGAAPPSALAFSGLYAFGDSLSDAGNLYLGTSGLHPIIPLPPPNPMPSPPSPPYFDGHFSNGLTWVEDLNTALGFGTLNPSGFPVPSSPFLPGGGKDFAVGGAQTGPTDIGSGTYDLRSQVDVSFPAYLALQSGAKISTSLVTLDIGANDIINGFKYDPTDISNIVSGAVSNTLLSVTTLHHDGVENLLFYTVPDLGVTPLFLAQGQTIADAASAEAAIFNSAVLTGLKKLETDGLHVFVLDTYTLLGDIVHDRNAYPQFTNVTMPCIDSLPDLAMNCPGYLFFDELHPTAAAHLLTAQDALAVLPVPEPSTWAMAVLGFLGLALSGARVSRSRASASGI